jgi:L-iditol 2-dehydrogenase
MIMTMLAAIFYGPGDLRMEEVPIPLPGPAEVLVQVAAATTCGTDLKSFRRGHPVLFPETPAPFGHEVAGKITAVGREVKNFKAGDAVVIANSAPCMRCFFCRKNLFSLCENLLFLNGAFAEYLLVPERIVRQNLYHLPRGTSFIAAALSEPLACALHGIEESDIQPDDTVVILGSGPLGLLLVTAARRKGARVIITGRGKERLQLAKTFGAEVILDVTNMSLNDQESAIRKETEEQRGADIVIEAIGTPETWEFAARLVRPGGLVNFFGGCPSNTQATFQTRPLHYSELTFKGVFHHTPALFAQALQLISSHAIEIEALISERRPLAETLEVFDLLQHKQGVKYALIPPAFAELLEQ